MSLVMLLACAASNLLPGATLPHERIAIVGVHADDKAAMLSWYGDTFGLVPRESSWFYLPDFSSIEMFDNGVAVDGAKSAAQQSVVPGFVVGDLDAATTMLAGAGVSVDGPDAGGRMSFADPEGNALALEEGRPASGSTALETIGWAQIAVERFDDTVAWYTHTFGLAAVEAPADGRATFALADGGVVEIVDGGTASDDRKDATEQSIGFGLEVDDLDAVIAELDGRGVVADPIGEWASDTWPDERWTSVVDPEGNGIGIKEIE